MSHPAENQPSENQSSEPASGDAPPQELEQWIVVDAGRIMGLPARLRELWPRELMPRARPAPTSAGEDRSSPTSAGESETVVLETAGDRSLRDLDVLSAWLAGFAAELNLTDSRLTVVISSGVETVHLAVGLGEDTGRAILALQGEGFEDFAGCQLLRRLDLRDIGQTVAGLSGFVERDCVLTVAWLTRTGRGGMEFLHRVDGMWRRPVLERARGSITVGAEAEAGRDAVRALFASVLTRLVAIGERA